MLWELFSRFVTQGTWQSNTIWWPGKEGRGKKKKKNKHPNPGEYKHSNKGINSP